MGFRNFIDTVMPRIVKPEQAASGANAEPLAKHTGTVRPDTAAIKDFAAQGPGMGNMRAFFDYASKNLAPQAGGSLAGIPPMVRQMLNVPSAAAEEDGALPANYRKGGKVAPKKAAPTKKAAAARKAPPTKKASTAKPRGWGAARGAKGTKYF